MFLDKTILTEQAHIGEELLEQNKATDLDRKCRVILQTVQDGIFTLEQALELYEVSKSYFEYFVAKSLVNELQLDISSEQPRKTQAVFAIEIIAQIYHQLFGSVDKNSADVMEHFKKFSKEIEEDKVLI